MKRKMLFLVFIAMSLSLVLFGCGSKYKVETKTPEESAKMQGDPLQNLAIKEKAWLVSLDAVHEDIKKSYTAWEQGKETKEEFLKQLGSSMDTVKGLKKEYNLHMEVNNFPPELENSPIYKDSLIYGKKLRSTVNNFIVKATDGVVDSKTNEFKKLNDEQIKDMYKTYMVEEYTQYKAKLEPALKIK